MTQQLLTRAIELESCDPETLAADLSRVYEEPVQMLQCKNLMDWYGEILIATQMAFYDSFDGLPFKIWS